MDVLDKFFIKYSYKFPKGYPDMNDEQDVLLMESILENEFGIVLEGKNLAPGELKKRENITTLINKIKDNEELELVDGDTFIVANKDEAIDGLNNLKSKGIELKDKDGNKITTSNLLKTTEFGGKPKSKDNISTTTDVKEGLVVHIYELLKDKKPLSPFTKENIKEQFNILGETDQPQDINEMVTISTLGKISLALSADVATEVSNWINAVINKLSTNPTSSEIRNILESVNNAYSIGNELAKSYPTSQAIRDDRFNNIRSAASQLTGLEEDKWNPSDIYLYSGGDISVKNALEQKAIGVINDLFNDDWGTTDKPLTGISLKQEKAQFGRAGSYLKYRFGDKQTFNPKTFKDIPYEQLLELINTEREKAQKIQGKKGGITVNYILDTNSKLTETQARTKLPSLKYFNTISESGDGDAIANFLGMFAFGEGLDQTGKVNPTFFKLVGNSKGAPPKNKEYYRGATVQYAIGSELKILDSNANSNIQLTADLEFISDGKSRISTVKKTFRTSGGSVGIL